MPIHLRPSPAASLTRRGFLAAAGASFALPALARSEDGGAIALLSDTHIDADPAARSLGESMAANLRAAVADVLAHPETPRSVVIAGDLALKAGKPGDYRQFLGLVDPLGRAGRAVHCLLGNHDDRGAFHAALGADRSASPVEGKSVAIVDHPRVRLVLLDSLDQVDTAPGRLGPGQLAWVARTLDARPDRPTIVAVHHNPDPSPQALSDQAALWETLRPRAQVKAVIYGHTHTFEIRDEGGIPRINLPAVAYPFGPGQPLGWCLLRPAEDGAILTLRALGGDRTKDGQVAQLRWRPS